MNGKGSVVRKIVQHLIYTREKCIFWLRYRSSIKKKDERQKSLQIGEFFFSV